MDSSVIKMIYRRANLAFPFGWSDFQVAFGSMWACLHSTELTEAIAVIVDVLMDDKVFTPVHYLDMDLMYTVVHDSVDSRTSALKAIPAGVGVGHREVTQSFLMDPVC